MEMHALRSIAGGPRRAPTALLRRARQVLSLVPARHRRAFAGAALVMALASGAQTAIPLLLGRLVDGVQGGSARGEAPRCST